MDDMTGQVVVITGANAGIGLEAARALAARGARLLVAGRDSDKSRRAVAEIGGDSSLIPLDLASLASVRQAAAEIASQTAKIDVLILNAGLWTAKREVSADGFEAMFAVNHLGHFLLTALLAPLLHAPARVVVVSSRAHVMGTMRWDDLMMERGWGSRAAYAQSKLANVLFTRELARRLAGAGVTANCCHPGVVATDLWRFLPRPLEWLATRAMLTPVQGAQPTLLLATAPHLANTTGKYFDRLVETEPTAEARDDAAAARLWEVSARLVGLPD